MTITWTETSIPINKLKDYKHNPRKITKKEYNNLVIKIKEDGYHSRIKVDKNFTIIGGDKRKKALLEVFGKDYKVQVLIPDRELTDEEFDRINIRDNLHSGTFDYDILSSRFDLEALSKIGMDENAIIGFDFEGKDNGGESKGKDEEKPKCTCDCCKH